MTNEKTLIYAIREIPREQWQKYQALCSLEGTNAAAKLREHIKKEARKFDKTYSKND